MAPVAGMSGVRVGMEWTREAPTAWQEALDRAFQPSEHLSSFYLRWEPGDRWQPIGRWMIWQLRPLRFTRPDVLKALQGPHPRSAGHYCAPGWCLCALKTNAWRGGATLPGAAMIDRGTWEVFRETGRYGTRWWTLQGTAGGHRHRLDPVEQQVCKLRGAPTATPAPGDLPYAEFDNRAFYKIAETDRVNRWKGLARFHERGSEVLEREARDAATAAGELLWGWLESQVQHTHEAVGAKGWKALAEAAPRVPWAPEPCMDMDATRESVVTESADALAGAA